MPHHHSLPPINRSSYAAHTTNMPLSEVVRTIAVVMPRGMLIAGFDAQAKVAVIRHSSYGREFPRWNDHYFANEAINEPLLGDTEEVAAIFIASDDILLVPDALYEQQPAEHWLRSTHYLNRHDALRQWHADADKLQCLYTCCDAVDKVLNQYFPKAKVLPVAACHLYKPGRGAEKVLLQCLLDDGIALATLHTNTGLQWQQQFYYSGMEDIAWQIMHLCRERGLHQHDVRLRCSAATPGSFDTIAALHEFFPEEAADTPQERQDADWAPVVYLMQQLYACAL